MSRALEKLRPPVAPLPPQSVGAAGPAPSAAQTPKKPVFRYDRDSRVERLMKGGFEQRVQTFRETGKALELQEIPEVLDSLLDLNSTELEEVIAKLGFRTTELRHTDGSPLGRVTPDYVIQLLGGNRHGAFNLLPTTPKQANLALDEASRRVKELTRKIEKLGGGGEPGAEHHRLSAELSRLQERRTELTSLRDRLAAVPRVHGWKELGWVSSILLSTGKQNPLDARTREERRAQVGETAPWYGKLLGVSNSVGVGMGISRVNRHTGKRDLIPYLQLSTDIAAGSVNYTLKRDERTLDTSIHPYFLTIGHDPVCGRHIYFAPPLGISFTIGERFLGIGIPKNRFNKARTPMLMSRFVDVDPILLLGIRGDPIQDFTGPAIRWTFKAYDAIKRYLGISERKTFQKAAPDTQSSDWLKPDHTLGTPFSRELFDD